MLILLENYPCLHQVTSGFSQPYAPILRAVPVPDKTATTAASALFNDVFLSTGFPSVLQSDRGGEWLNALLHTITKLLSIKHVFTSGFRPHLNCATERIHHFLNAASGIFCEKQQENGNSFYNQQFMPTSPQFLVLPISHHFSSFLAVILPSPETISLELPVHPLPPDHYGKHLISSLVRPRWSHKFCVLTVSHFLRRNKPFLRWSV